MWWGWRRSEGELGWVQPPSDEQSVLINLPINSAYTDQMHHHSWFLLSKSVMETWEATRCIEKQRRLWAQPQCKLSFLRILLVSILQVRLASKSKAKGTKLSLWMLIWYKLKYLYCFYLEEIRRHICFSITQAKYSFQFFLLSAESVSQR